MQQAIDLFHERHPDTQLQIAVSRQPYSWAGDNRDEDLQGRFTQFAKGGFQQERAASQLQRQKVFAAASTVGI